MASRLTLPPPPAWRWREEAWELVQCDTLNDALPVHALPVHYALVVHDAMAVHHALAVHHAPAVYHALAVHDALAVHEKDFISVSSSSLCLSLPLSLCLPPSIPPYLPPPSTSRTLTVSLCMSVSEIRNN